MKMQSCRGVAQVVDSINYNLISNRHINCRQRKLLIDGDNGTRKSIWGSADPSNIEIVRNNFCQGEANT